MKLKSVFWSASMILFLATALPSGAQSRIERQLTKAVNAYHSGNLSTAESLAFSLLQRSPDYTNALLLLADIYLERGDSRAEIEILIRAIQNKNVPVSAHLRLAQAFFKEMRYEEAMNSASIFLTKNITPQQKQTAERVLASARLGYQSVRQGHKVTLLPAGPGINTTNDEYWPYLTLNATTLLFTRRLRETNYVREDLYASQLTEKGWSLAMPLDNLNSHLNEGAATLSADGTILFYTLCNHPRGFGSCDIWFSKLSEAGWSQPRNAGPALNTTAWEGQPSLTASGRDLYFSSNRSGGMGGRDLWKIPLLGWNDHEMPIWGVASNLGDPVNSPGDEISPFIHFNESDLFFSSDYHIGLGGLDLFKTTLQGDGRFSEPINLGYPINSPGNEQGMVIDYSGIKAYIASNRSETHPMDIYQFDLPEPLRPKAVSFVAGKVTDKTTGENLRAILSLSNLSEPSAEKIILPTDFKGNYIAPLPSGSEFLLVLHEKGYLFHTEKIAVPETRPEPYYINIQLSPIKVGEISQLHHIYFETDRWELRPGSETELEFLFQLLKQNPTMEAEIQGHTDSSGNDHANKTLSEKRAEAVAGYLINRGVSAGRLTIAGYGDTMPVASNETEEGKAFNRRTAIKITGF